LFTQDEKTFLDWLTDHNQMPSPFERELTSSQMRKFQELAARCQEEIHADDPLEEKPETPPKAAKVPMDPRPASENGSLNQHIVAHETRKSVVGNVQQRLEGAQKVIDKVSTEAYWLVWYYIPIQLDPEGLNPSRTFRRLGFRFDGSCWIMPESSLNSPAFKEVLAMWDEWKAPTDGRPGMDYCYIKQDSAYQNMLRDRALLYLERTVMDAHTSLITSIDSASKSYDTAMKLAEEAGDNLRSREGKKKVDKLLSRRISHVKGALKEVREKLTAAIECAVLFDQSMAIQDLLRGLREVIASGDQGLKVLQEARELHNG
jgi:hypothetical protein